MKVENIRSIRWLHCADGSVNLTPCFDGNIMPRFVNISRNEFEEIRGDEILMKKKIVAVLSQK